MLAKTSMNNEFKFWTLNKSHWDTLESNFGEYINSNKWTRVPFQQNHKDSVNTSNGVYIICAYSPLRKPKKGNEPNLVFNSLYAPMYIGSGKIRDRFSQHVGENPKNERIMEIRQCFNTNLEFWYCVIEENQMKQFEDSLERCFNTYANKIHPINERNSLIGDYGLKEPLPVKTINFK